MGVFPWDAVASGVGSLIDAGVGVANLVQQKKENEKDRKFNAAQAEKNRLFQAAEAEKAYEREVEFYNSTQSPSAMVEQYKNAGLNPALMAGGSVGAGSVSASAPSGSSASSSSSALPSMPSIMEAALSMKSILASIKKTEKETEGQEIDNQMKSKEVSWYDAYMSTNLEQMKSSIDKVKSDIEVNGSLVEKNLQDVQESLKRVELHDSTIEVNGSVVELNGSQKDLNEVKSIMENMNVEHMKKLLPFVERLKEAEIALAQAKTAEANSHAEKLIYDANFSMLKCITEMKLIDSSYYDSVIDQAHWDAKYKKREHKWAPIQNICHDVSMLMIGAGSLIGGVSKLTPMGAVSKIGYK